ncbi:MAG: regulatory protein RecX [Treponema sp.]|nr:regulatory protein RecX [Treponema sp.]
MEELDLSAALDGADNPAVQLAITAAARSLARAEQCRATLEKKLLQKEFDEETVKTALDYLESKKYLDDARYASMWIRNHEAFKPQGKIRILLELTRRGVKKNIAENAIMEYFIDDKEESLCEEAFLKLSSKKKDQQKLFKSLADRGFSYSIIQKTFKKYKEALDGTE